MSSEVGALVRRADPRRQVTDEERAWPAARWAWEFLRRSKAYDDGYRGYIRALARIDADEAKDVDGSLKKRLAFRRRGIEMPFRSTWGVPPTDPNLDEPPAFDCVEAEPAERSKTLPLPPILGVPIPEDRLFFPDDASRARYRRLAKGMTVGTDPLDRAALQELGSRFFALEREEQIELGFGEIAFRLDLGQPLEPQLERIGSYARELQVEAQEQGVIRLAHRRIKRPGLLPRYLRVVDAVADGLAPKDGAVALNLAGFEECTPARFSDWKRLALPFVLEGEYLAIIRRWSWEQNE